jgi:hypothetical protein
LIFSRVLEPLAWWLEEVLIEVAVVSAFGARWSSDSVRGRCLAKSLVDSVRCGRLAHVRGQQNHLRDRAVPSVYYSGDTATGDRYREGGRFSCA